MTKHTVQFTVEEAENIAISGLAFLGQDMQRLGNFLATTGVNPADLRALAGTPGFLVSVLDYLLQDESLLLVFTSENGVDPESVKPGIELNSSSSLSHLVTSRPETSGS